MENQEIMNDQEIMDKQFFTTKKDILEYEEDFIIDKKTHELIYFSLSNKFDAINFIFHANTGLKIDLNNAYWQIGSRISNSIKNLMIKHRVNYSIAILEDEKEKSKYLVIFIRAGDKWFFKFYSERNDKIYSVYYRNIKSLNSYKGKIALRMITMSNEAQEQVVEENIIPKDGQIFCLSTLFDEKEYTDGLLVDEAFLKTMNLMQEDLHLPEEKFKSLKQFIANNSVHWMKKGLQWADNIYYKLFEEASKD